MSVPAHILLGQVIATADDVLNRPARATRERVCALLAEVKLRHEKPSEHPRRTHFAMMLLDALDHVMIARRDGSGDAVKWAMIAGVIVPCVKEDVPLALADERAQLADTF